MSHMVIYRGSDGKPGYHQTDDIHDAVGFVEQMRNDQDVEHARIFRLEEVVFQYKPYYRVELAESGAGELGITADTAADGSPGNHTGPGSEKGSGSGELTIDTNSGSVTTIAGGNGFSDASAGVATGAGTQPTSSSAPATSPASPGAPDNAAGSKRGLFGR